MGVCAMYFDLEVECKNTKFCKLDINSELKIYLILEIR